MKRWTALVGAISLLSVTGCRVVAVGPHGGRWELLGSRLVEFHADHDAVLAGLQGSYRAIRIDVDRAPLEMYDIKVNFANGESYSPDIRHHFREGGWSRIIDLPGLKRVIKSVEFWYKTTHRGEGRAKVDVWGLH